MVDNEIEVVKLTRQDDRDADVRRNNMAGVRYSIDRVPDQVSDAVCRLVRSYGLRFAAIDMMFSNNEWYFLEVNANGQWALAGFGCWRKHLQAISESLR
jgi:glutathione synthase/RimK-type ligase-like ATP-grasp enzyme